MTRGRKKDLTIPPTRALAQQRDYRARKAQYVADLEERCRKAEAENLQLKKELELARAGAAPPPAVSVVSRITPQLSSDLMQSLTAASASLARFQQLVFSESTPPPPPPLPHSTSSNKLRPASFPSPVPSPPYIHKLSISELTTPSEPPDAGRKRPRTDSMSSTESSHRYYYQRQDTRSVSRETGTSRSRTRSPSPHLGSECCGGILNCEHLVEDGHGNSPPLPRFSRLQSDIRATRPHVDDS